MVQAALTERVVHRVHRRYLWIPVGEPRIGFALRSCQRRLSQSGCFDQSRAAFLTQPVAVAPDGDDLAVVQQPVENRRAPCKWDREFESGLLQRRVVRTMVTAETRS